MVVGGVMGAEGSVIGGRMRGSDWLGNRVIQHVGSISNICHLWWEGYQLGAFQTQIHLVARFMEFHRKGLRAGHRHGNRLRYLRAYQRIS